MKYVWLLFFNQNGWNGTLTTTLEGIFSTQEQAEQEKKVLTELCEDSTCYYHVTRWEVL